MTRDDIIQMAWEAGFQVLLPQDHVDGTGGVYVVEDEIAGMLERFAALVAEREREACAIAGGAAAMAGLDHLQVAAAIRARGET